MEGWLSQPRFWDVTWNHSRPRCQIAALLLGAHLHQPCLKGMRNNGQKIVHPENTKWFSWTQKGHFYGSMWRSLISPFDAWIGFTQTRFILALIECPIQRNHVGQKAKTEQNKTKITAKSRECWTRGTHRSYGIIYHTHPFSMAKRDSEFIPILVFSAWNHATDSDHV